MKMKRSELKAALKEALAEFLEPISARENRTRTMIGLPPLDVSKKENVAYELDLFEKGFLEAEAGFYDKFYEDKRGFKAYQAGNFAGREFFPGEPEHFVVIPYQT